VTEKSPPYEHLRHPIFWEADDVVDLNALARNVASALPDVAFRERFEHPIPNLALREIARHAETNAVALGRPVLIPEEE
jgi:hypothetical protein